MRQIVVICTGLGSVRSDFSSHVAIVHARAAVHCEDQANEKEGASPSALRFRPLRPSTASDVVVYDFGSWPVSTSWTSRRHRKGAVRAG